VRAVVARSVRQATTALRKGGAMNHEERTRKIAEIEVATALVLRQVSEADCGGDPARDYVVDDVVVAGDRRVALIHHHLLSLLSALDREVLDLHA
jgi:hypothetical protein